MGKTNEMGSSARVLQTITDLVNVHRPASRQNIAKITGMKMSQVDDCVKRLRDDGKILLVAPGLFEPVPIWPEDRAISKTVLPTGLTKIEIGDKYLELTPHEVRTLGLQLYGDAMELVRMRNERELLGDFAAVRQEVKGIKAWRQEIVNEVANLKRTQADLFESAPA